MLLALRFGHDSFCLVLFDQVDEKLKEIFKDLEDGTWIFSSKLLCSTNFRMSPRKVSELPNQLIFK